MKIASCFNHYQTNKIAAFEAKASIFRFLIFPHRRQYFIWDITEHTYSDINIDIILQIIQEESCFLSISICNPPFSMLRISEKLKVLVRFSQVRRSGKYLSLRIKNTVLIRNIRWIHLNTLLFQHILTFI